MKEQSTTPNRVVSEQVIEAPASPLVLNKVFVRRLKKADTAPSILNTQIAIAQNTAPVTVVDFTNGAAGQRLHVLGDSLTTVAYGTNIKTNTGVDKLLLVDLVYTFTRINGVWYEADGGGGGGSGTALVRDTVTKVTGSLANNAQETGTITLAKSGLILSVTADCACWVRFYGTSAERAADAARLITVDPVFSTPVLADLIFTAGFLVIDAAPLIGYANRDGTPTTDIYYTITNMSGSTNTVQIDVTHQSLEI